MSNTEADFLTGENEGEALENPRFICEACGLANVALIDAGPLPAAKCTNCGMGYYEKGDT